MGNNASSLYPDGGKPITMDRIRGACRINTKITPDAQRFLVEGLVRDLNLYSGANIQLRAANGQLRGLGDVCDEVYEMIPNADSVCKLNKSGSANIDEIVKLAKKFNQAYGSSIQIYRDPLDPKSGKLPPDDICGQLFQVQDFVRRSLRSDFDLLQSEFTDRLEQLKQLRATIMAEDAAYGLNPILDLKEEDEANRIARQRDVTTGIRKAADTLLYTIQSRYQDTLDEINDGIVRDTQLAAAIKRVGGLDNDNNAMVKIAVDPSTMSGGGHGHNNDQSSISMIGGADQRYNPAAATRLVHSAVLTNAAKVDQAFRNLPVPLIGDKAQLREKVLSEIDQLKQYPHLYKDFEPIEKALRRDSYVMKEAEQFASTADRFASLLNK